jgi:hypothetical protein
MSGSGLRPDEVAFAREGARRSRRREPERERSAMGAMFSIFPLILVPVLIYNIIAFVGSGLQGAEAVRARISAKVFEVPMASGVQWLVTWGDLLLFVAMVLLFIELLKSTSTGSQAIFNHAMSMLVFIICLIEFLLHPAFATSVFFLIMMMSLLDVLAGVIVTIVSARRDVEFDRSQA